jgi:hypothetical protein
MPTLLRGPTYTRRVSETELPPEEAPDDVTVGAWLDVDAPAPEQSTVMPEPSQTQQPGLFARIMRALRGGGS